MSSTLTALVTTPAGLAWLFSLGCNAAVLVATAWLGTVLWRRSTAAGRHRLWALAVAATLLMPLLLLTLSSPRAPLATSADVRGVPQPLATVGEDAGPSLAREVTPQHTRADHDALPRWPTLLATVWALGAIMVALRFGRDYLAARRLSQSAAPADAPTWFAAQRAAADALAMQHHVELGRSTAIASPMTVGVLRPRVLLPAAADAWSADRLRAVLVHELGHIRRRDTQLQFCAQLACVVYWWNPLLWLAAARLRLEREFACDDLVLGAGIRPSTYAAELLDVAQFLQPNQTGHAGVIFMVEPSSLATRLQRILNNAAPRQSLGATFFIVSSSAALALAVTLACNATQLELPAPSSNQAVAADATPAPSVDHGTLTLGAAFVDRNRGATGFAPLTFRVPVGQPSTFEAFDLAMAAAEVQRHVGPLLQCYQRQLRVHPALAGRVVIHWYLNADGTVADQCITEATINDFEVQACVNNLISKAHFAAPRGGPLDVTLPFEFTARP